uniref:Uncharacterized protein n=1 Tax=Megaviridae environmental sample TaxID=1737588 RepID=A0A5J6VJH4_9VIRU|nr:MAG: hypothetical protein [Megaviridae environmental sample]
MKWYIVLYACMLVYCLSVSCWNFIYIKNLNQTKAGIVLASSVMGFVFSFRGVFYNTRATVCERVFGFIVSVILACTWITLMFKYWIQNLCMCVFIASSYLFNIFRYMYTHSYINVLSTRNNVLSTLDIE